MRIYVAGGPSFDTGRIVTRTGHGRFLLSFADRSSAAFSRRLSAAPDVFLDSGAYGIHSGSAKTFPLSEYCDFIREHASGLSAYACLDVIGDWRQTFANLSGMRAAGLDPVPVFHRGEPLDVLHGMCRDAGYIALGGAGNLSLSAARKVLVPYLDSCWEVIGRHWPVRVHGFAMASQWILERYPFYSADSTAATKGAGMGKVVRVREGRSTRVEWRRELSETWNADLVDMGRDPSATSAACGQARVESSIRSLLSTERYVTDLWSGKGISWQ